MLSQLIEYLGSFIIAVISATGYFGVLVLMTIEFGLHPPALGNHHALCRLSGLDGPADALGVALAGAVGCNIGSTIAYAIGAWGGRPLAERWGRYVLLNPTTSTWPNASLPAGARRRCSSAGCCR